MTKMDYEKRKRYDKVGAPRARPTGITKAQRRARNYALRYEGNFPFMLSMHREAIFNDDWYPSPRQAEAILKCKKNDNPWKKLKNKYQTDCISCGKNIKVGHKIWWHVKTKVVRHANCPVPKS